MKLWWRYLYRPLMKLAHRYNWHYTHTMYLDGDKILWCQWCGLRGKAIDYDNPSTVLACDVKCVKENKL